MEFTVGIRVEVGVVCHRLVIGFHVFMTHGYDSRLGSGHATCLDQSQCWDPM